jgi:hypothetical protein
MLENRYLVFRGGSKALVSWCVFAAKYSGNWAFGVNLPYRHLGPIALVAVICLVLLLIILVLRRKREKSIPSSSPPPAVPSLPVTGPYLESASITGDRHRFGLKADGVSIGRSLENDLIITQDFPEWETVSQRHAWIYQWVDHWIVEDISSMNGIQVNGRRTGRNLLRDGWQLDIGGVEFVFRATTEETEQ